MGKGEGIFPLLGERAVWERTFRAYGQTPHVEFGGRDVAGRVILPHFQSDLLLMSSCHKEMDSTKLSSLSKTSMP